MSFDDDLLNKDDVIYLKQNDLLLHVQFVM